MLVDIKYKCQYYTQVVLNKEAHDLVDYNQYKTEIDAIDDNVVEAWKQKQEALSSLTATDLKSIRGIEEILEMLRADGIWSEQDPRLAAEVKDRLSLRRGNRSIVKQVGVALADGDIDAADAEEITDEQTTFWNTLKGWFT